MPSALCPLPFFGQTDWVGTINIMTQITDTGTGKTVPVKAIEVLELSEEEQRLRLHLERVVERSFYEAGIALKQLRDRKLYRSSHSTFDLYCRDRTSSPCPILTQQLRLCSTVIVATDCKSGE